MGDSSLSAKPSGTRASRAIALLYHDVVARDRFETSGMSGAAAGLYKMTPEDFATHLEAVSEVAGIRVVRVSELDSMPPAATPVMLTFDDGGSSFPEIGRMLEQHGWRGHFFISSGYVGRPTFMSRAEIREMHQAGHVIGSHSATHPARLSAASPEEIRREWQQSVDDLSDIVGAPITTASVPGGYYSQEVARQAAACGIRDLFVSDPTAKLWELGGCRMIGRYCAKQSDPGSWAKARVAQDPKVLLRESVTWNAKKFVKKVGGKRFIQLRRLILTGTPGPPGPPPELR